MRRSERGEFDLVTSAEVLMELLEVLRRPKFRRYITEDEAVDFALRIHDGSADVSEEMPKEVVMGVTSDPDDDYLAGVAVRGQAGIIVSGDRHLLELPDRRIADGLGNTLARILSPREFLGELGHSR